MHQRVRWAMLAMLLLVASVVGIGQQQTERLERQRRDDTELISLASRQGMWSQQIARQAVLLHSLPDDRDAADRALQQAVSASQREALRLDQLVDAQASASAAAAAVLQPAMAQWHGARERLWYRAEGVLRSLGERQGNEFLRAAVVALQRDVEPALATAQAIAERSGEAARARSDEAIGTLRTAALFIGALLLFLALGVAEPTVRAVRRQAGQLAAQADELARLALVAEHTHLAVIITDATGRAVWVNQAFERITGFAPTEVLGHNPLRVLQAGGTDAQWIQPIRQALNGGSGVRAELPSRTRDGHEYWLDLDLQPLHDAAGALSGFVGVANDITERVTQRLKTAAMLEALPTGVLVQDNTGRVVECNPAAERALGLPREILIDDRPRPDHWKLLREDLSEVSRSHTPGARALREGVGLRGETLGVAAEDGSLRWLLVNAEPIRDAFGHVSGAVSCLTDVTDQRNQRVLLEMTVAAADVGTWQWDMHSNELSCNERFMTMLGYAPGSVPLSGIALGSLVHPDDVEPRREALQLHLNNPEHAFRFEQRLRRPDGDWATVLCCGTVIERSDNGRARRMAGIHFDMTEQVQMQAMLRHAARTDGLTQLPNRAAVFDRVQQALQRASERPEFGYAVLFMDFDRFKQVNDTLGHAVGDELLRQIAHRLRKTLRAGDTVGRGPSYEHTAGRIGGDEFVVVLEAVQSRDDVCVVARRLLEALAEPYRIGSHVVHSTASIGIVTSEQAANDANTVMRDADTAMYEAKRAGRGRFVVFDPSMHERVAHTLSIENDLRLALQRDELFVVYQPVIEFDAAGTGAVEALVRWQHPSRGQVSPAEFIAVAEESGLIVELGRQVLTVACHQFVAWQQQLGALAPRSVAVNLSTVQLRQPNFIAEVRECLRSTGIAPHQLQLEVTESLAAQDELARERLRELKALGLSIALDDFGTGYSSLACLHQLPVDTVKIDRSFVSHAETSEYHRALIEATIRVAQTLGMTTVAEGIETPGQARLMQQLQCGRGQGYLYSRPLRAEALTQWLTLRARQSLRDAA
ncbi:sensor domain-containing protein [Aquabacterium sp.]|uniref:sensor domain-containing protein n=1 Tax=Aquabacterium sp. TaxID=1872578 RepID=UPI002CDF5A1A|nr:EAL domain-containing protein [Aquabacterium sp.]HSW03738.1 EAL domain-containing protein [Aquabacterium sp.]